MLVWSVCRHSCVEDVEGLGVRLDRGHGPDDDDAVRRVIFRWAVDVS